MLILIPPLGHRLFQMAIPFNMSYNIRPLRVIAPMRPDDFSVLNDSNTQVIRFVYEAISDVVATITPYLFLDYFILEALVKL